MSEIGRTPEVPSHIPDYDLRLPPAGQSLESDELAVRELSDPAVRAGLEEVNVAVTEHYRRLEAEGYAVRPLFRGATASSGIVVTVAEVAPAAEVDPEAIGEETYARRPPILDTPHSGLLVTLGVLDELNTSEGRELAATPRELERQPDSRDGMMEYRVMVAGGYVTLRVPRGNIWQEPSVRREPVTSFRDAAFGERRTEAARKSLAWIPGWEPGTFDSLRPRPGVDLRAALTAYYQQQLDELYEHPEWFDQPVDPFAGISDEELVVFDKLSTVPQYADAKRFRGKANQYIREHHLVHPDDVAVIGRTMMKAPVAGEDNTRNYHKGHIGPSRAIGFAIHDARLQRLKEAGILI